MSEGIKIDFSIAHDETEAFVKALERMGAKSVLAGFPEDEKPREDAEGNPESITNAALAYVHNTGMPEQNIPARPFMEQGIENKRQEITDGMEKAGRAALNSDGDTLEKELLAVALTAKIGIQEKILDGPFEPLKESTLKARARMSGDIGTAAQTELDSRKSGNAPDPENSRPLNLTGQLRNAVQGLVE